MTFHHQAPRNDVLTDADRARLAALAAKRGALSDWERGELAALLFRAPDQATQDAVSGLSAKQPSAAKQVQDARLGRRA